MKKKSKNGKNYNALSRVRKYFPDVKKVVDGEKSIIISVLPEDNESGRRKDPASCALARACCRQGIAEGAIINIGTSYLIRGDTAYRYRTSETVAREIVSFDRHKEFAPGKDYRLSAMSPSCKLGTNYRSPGVNPPREVVKSKTVVIPKHRTTNVRVSKA